MKEEFQMIEVNGTGVRLSEERKLGAIYGNEELGGEERC